MIQRLLHAPTRAPCIHMCLQLCRSCPSAIYHVQAMRSALVHLAIIVMLCHSPAECLSKGSFLEEAHFQKNSQAGLRQEANQP